MLLALTALFSGCAHSENSRLVGLVSPDSFSGRPFWANQEGGLDQPGSGVVSSGYAETVVPGLGVKGTLRHRGEVTVYPGVTVGGAVGGLEGTSAAGFVRWRKAIGENAWLSPHVGVGYLSATYASSEEYSEDDMGWQANVTDYYAEGGLRGTIGYGKWVDATGGFVLQVASLASANSFTCTDQPPSNYPCDPNRPLAGHGVELLPYLTAGVRVGHPRVGLYAHLVLPFRHESLPTKPEGMPRLLGGGLYVSWDFGGDGSP